MILDQVNSLAKPPDGQTPNMFSSNDGGLFLERTYDSMADLLLYLDEFLCRKLWFNILPDLKLLDPACGSGAFLVAALKTLLNVYSAIIGKMETLGDKGLKDELDKIHAEHPSINYYIKKRIITNNLYGVDIMEEGTEIAKLRLFMTLVSSVHHKEELEPLPNIDFNILFGNSLIGLLRVSDTEFLDSQNHLFRQSFREIVETRENNVENYRKATSTERDLAKFRGEIEKGDEAINDILNKILLKNFTELKISYEQATWDEVKLKEGKPKKRPLTLKDVEHLKPFHWGYNFSTIIHKKGGFDAIITNPPWEVFQTDEKEFFEEILPKEQREEIYKKKTRNEDWKKQFVELMQDKEQRNAWLEYSSRFPYVSKFFKTANQYKNQISIINGKNAGTKINLYNLFIEQCFNLLHKKGRCGIIVQGGIYTDLSTKQLREMLFTEGKVDTLFGFSNEKFIFENVHHAQKFCILVFEKGGSTKNFSAAFRINPREAIKTDNLERFLNSSKEHIKISVDLVKRLSPDSLSIMEFKNHIDIQIAEKMLGFSLLGEYIEDKWSLKLSQEFNMTTDSHLFKNSNGEGRLPLYEGKMIHQFTHLWGEPKYWLDEDEARNKLLNSRIRTIRQTAKKNNLDWEDKDNKKIQLDYDNFRPAFRDVTSNSNERTMIMTVLPPKVFCPHTMSLEQVFSVELDGKEIKPNIRRMNSREKLFVCALMNSFVIDSWLRRSVTNHISFFFIYGLPFPRLTGNNKEFTPIVERAAKLICTTPEFDDLAKEIGLESYKNGATDQLERQNLRAELDALVAHLYGLTEEEFAYILTTFPLVSEPVKVATQNAFRDVERGLIK